METNNLNLDPGKKQSLEAWVTEVMLPVLSAIGHISYQLELLYRELN